MSEPIKITIHTDDDHADYEKTFDNPKEAVDWCDDVIYMLFDGDGDFQ